MPRTKKAYGSEFSDDADELLAELSDEAGLSEPDDPATEEILNDIEAGGNRQFKGWRILVGPPMGSCLSVSSDDSIGDRSTRTLKKDWSYVFVRFLKSPNGTSEFTTFYTIRADTIEEARKAMKKLENEVELDRSPESNAGVYRVHKSADTIPYGVTMMEADDYLSVLRFLKGEESAYEKIWGKNRKGGKPKKGRAHTNI